MSRAIAFEQRAHLVDLGLHLFRGSVGFAKKDRLGVERIAGMHEWLDRADGKPVHHFEARRNDARGDDCRHRLSRLGQVVERGEDHLCLPRFGRQVHGHLGDDRQQALRSVDQCEQIVAGTIERIAAEFHNFAGDKHCSHPADVVHGEPVLETVQAAGILGDVATDRARDLR